MDKEFKRLTNIPARDIRNFLTDPKEKVWNGPFTFIQAADCQFGMIASYKDKQDQPCWDKEVKIGKQTIANINRMVPSPRFFAICGDMLDAFPFDRPPLFYTKSSKLDKELRLVQYESFVEVFKKLNPKVKLICACGNHDAGDIPTKETMELYNKQFGPDYFDFWVGGVKFVVINSQLLMSPDALPEELEKQNKYLDTIKDDRAKFIVVLQHIPPFMKDVDEEDTYQNIPKEVRVPYLEILNDSGVSYIFCGHSHENSGGKYKNIEIVVTSAMGAPMGNDPSGYRIVHVEETGLKHEYIDISEFDDIKEDKSCCNKCSIMYILTKGQS